MYSAGYILSFTVQTTRAFGEWLDGLRDARAKAAVARRLKRMQAGNFGDMKPVGDGVSELRVDVGPGYRVYFVQRGQRLVVVLAGGDKSSQDRDIQRAKALAKEL
ncbi:type II toxin-antitoxin system RelE/ParE family toxin [Xylophilus rhododendri]|uniref:Type II toxin-antitoxin system RelE/ParE family toxin n=1 Tax=Xylophilus rhododendri TaxID=2697032 RepID=A0A857J0C0_9BURK|nr:type II toxin-antitoxin system RelE/ParE family toxin [Xylophilus rhododendri]QHI97166.1 type II toxin-antitoxin system RelE/ParE family toxin [Xylophilus rhododendri]